MALAFTSLTAQAALPPAAESLRRFAAVAQSKDVYATLGVMQWVKSIQANPMDETFTVVGSSCTMIVKVHAQQSNPPQGSPPFDVSVISCRGECHAR